jgi:hypothetical protein
MTPSTAIIPNMQKPTCRGMGGLVNKCGFHICEPLHIEFPEVLLIFTIDVVPEVLKGVPRIRGTDHEY